MFNVLSLFVSLREKILGLTALFMLGLASGWYIHTVIDDALAYDTAKTQLEQAKIVPAKLSKFHQDIRKTNVENTACFNTSIPNDALKLLH